MHNSLSMRSDEEDPKTPKPVGIGHQRTFNPNEDPKQPSPVLTGRKGTNALEMLEAQGRTTVMNDDLDRHQHV